MVWLGNAITVSEGSMGASPSPHHPSEASARPHSGFSRIMHHGLPLALHARYAQSDFGSSGPYVADTFGRTPALLCVLQLRDFPRGNGWRDGQHVDVPLLAAGSLMLLDLRHSWQTEVNAPFDNIHLNITQASLDTLAEASEIGAVDIAMPPFAPQFDEVLRHLALSLMPALLRPTEMNSLFAEHISIAAAIHVVQTYGGGGSVVRRLAGGLAPWQERRARDFLLAHLDTDVDPTRLAAICGLSPAHFAKAFKRTVGAPPHRWLLKQRVARACDLLMHSGESLDAIALACGFADQSHMSRVFSKAMGAPPGTWRRVRRS